MPSIHCIARAINFGGRPNNGLASNPPQPPRRQRASQPAIVRTVTPKARAAAEGLSPACTRRPFDELRSAHAQSLQRLVIQFARIVICDALKESHGLRAVNKNTKILMDGLILAAGGNSRMRHEKTRRPHGSTALRRSDRNLPADFDDVVAR